MSAALLLTLSLLAAGGSPVTEGYVTADDGVKLYYRAVGSGREAVVVPVAVWLSPHLDALARKGRRVVYFDPRGRGRSDLGDLEHASPVQAVKDLEALRAQLGLEKLALVGWSGAAVEVALYALAHPERVTRLVQLAPAPPRLEPYQSRRAEGMGPRVDGKAWAEADRIEKAGGTKQAHCEAVQRALLPAFFAHPERVGAAQLKDLCGSTNEWPENAHRFQGAYLPRLEQVDVRRDLAKLKLPRLVVHPEKDLLPLEAAREWLGGGKNVRLLTVRGADHGVFLDAPEVVLPALERFLAGAWPRGAQAR